MSSKDFALVDNQGWVLGFFSEPRIGPYLREYPNDLDLALNSYLQDLESVGKLMVLLNLFEVGLRNAISRELDQAYASALGSWTDEAEQILKSEALSTFRKTTARIMNSGKAITHSTVISSLPFGFWVNLLGRSYEATLWTKALNRAFRGNEKLSRTMVHDRLTDIYRLRNKVAHHGIVVRADFEDHRNKIMNVLLWISPQGHAWALNAITPGAFIASNVEVTPGSSPQV